LGTNGENSSCSRDGGQVPNLKPEVMEIATTTESLWLRMKISKEEASDLMKESIS